MGNERRINNNNENDSINSNLLQTSEFRRRRIYFWSPQLQLNQLACISLVPTFHFINWEVFNHNSLVLNDRVYVYCRCFANAKFQFSLEAIVSIQSKSDYLTISSEYRKNVHIVQALRVSENSFNPDFRICTQTNVEPYAHK